MGHSTHLKVYPILIGASTIRKRWHKWRSRWWSCCITIHSQIIKSLSSPSYHYLNCQTRNVVHPANKQNKNSAFQEQALKRCIMTTNIRSLNELCKSNDSNQAGAKVVSATVSFTNHKCEEGIKRFTTQVLATDAAYIWALKNTSLHRSKCQLTIGAKLTHSKKV